ncbi:MAG TPA: LD-carboxypeptidase [Gemmatimonadaceae bacterium]|nr:LD-carboxypeptidase [Gemmatimonadaceae bacterium]
MSPVTPLIAPPPLAPGARVALIAPAGPLRGEEDVARAESNARALGWEPVVAEGALSRRGYLAGPDDERAAELRAALDDPRVDGVWCLRGGYGTMRILDVLDYDVLRRRPRPLIGFSDITALHLAIAARAGIVSYHGPTARGTLTDFSLDSLDRALSRRGDPCGAVPGARTLREGRAVGRLVGGNLALVAALVGTPYAARLDDAILVLEDVGEPTYRIDRMLRQLRLAGALRGVRGIIFGAFTERGADDDPALLDELLRETADALRVPCIADAPVGHIDDQWTLPLGAIAELDASEGAVRVEWGDELR